MARLIKDGPIPSVPIAEDFSGADLARCPDAGNYPHGCDYSSMLKIQGAQCLKRQQSRWLLSCTSALERNNEKLRAINNSRPSVRARDQSLCWLTKESLPPSVKVQVEEQT